MRQVMEQFRQVRKVKISQQSESSTTNKSDQTYRLDI
jgi:hypothetical protein